MRWSGWLFAGTLLVLLGTAVTGGDQPEKDKPMNDDKEPDQYINVEVKGKLQHGVFAIGGETTGTVVTANNITWELHLGKEAELQKTAEKLSGQPVLVTGTLEKRKGVEIRQRWIVHVETLKPADGE